ncbi:putative polygalacturonase [Ananas comosus]|uniref:endo-polygalacturonase n=1 Tax=Ananas comosus TaxID=4615 RepID=A0A199VFK8_ANACO|nr:putative polygalacturonase [Ananas comosus]
MGAAPPPSKSSVPLSLLLLLICVQIIASRSASVCRSRRVVSVDDFGAVGDGTTDDTKAFVDAWNATCSSPVSTVLEIPAGKVFFVGPTYFAGPCKAKLKLSILGTIVAPSDPDTWGKLDTHKWLYFHRVSRLVMRGGGTIDGNGHEWWARSCKRNKTNPCRPAPKAITFHRCKHLTVKELTLINSQQMHMAFSMCSHVRASHLKVIAPAESPNTDGIHVSESVSVVVKDSTIGTGDDCISIVGNSSSVWIRGILCGPGHGISIGSLGKSKSHDEVHNIQVDRCLIKNTENGVRIKTWQGGSGSARKILFRNILMKNVSNPIIIDQYYCDSPSPCQNQTMAVKVAEVSFIGIKGTSATKDAIRFVCSDSLPCDKLYLKDIHLSLESGGEAAAYCWKALGSSSGFVQPPSCLTSADHHLIKQYINCGSKNSTTGYI